MKISGDIKNQSYDSIPSFDIICMVINHQKMETKYQNSLRKSCCGILRVLGPRDWLVIRQNLSRQPGGPLDDG